MFTKKERLEKMNAMGIETGKFFTLNVDKEIPVGTKIHVVIGENGVATPVVLSENTNDPILNQIITDGYVKNTKLFRRFVMAQMFHMLNYVSYDGMESGFNACLRNMYGYHYTLTMMVEEIRVLSKLEKRDKESFDERSHFFTKRVIVDILCDYVEKLKMVALACRASAPKLRSLMVLSQATSLPSL